MFCSSCGKELPENAYFCPGCGVRTGKGDVTGVGSPWEEVREGFERMGEELEKAFERAGRELERAFETVRKDVKEAAGKAQIVCSECGTKNTIGSNFCYKCGKKLG